MTAAPAIAIDPEDRLRADLYNYIGLMLSAPPDAVLLEQTAALGGDEGVLGRAIHALAAAAKDADPRTVRSEFNALFIGLGRGELLPYASFYLTGFLNEKPLARLRTDMSALGISRARDVFEPEDSAAALMEMMGGMIVGRFGAPATGAQQRTFFGAHVAPWAPHFFTDLTCAKNAVLYARLGEVGRVFLDIEREAFRLTS